MYDTPTPDELLAAVARYLRDDAGPALGRSGAQPDNSALAYQARVAANMLDMVRRQGLLAPLAEAAERARLLTLLGEAGAIEAIDATGTTSTTSTPDTPDTPDTPIEIDRAAGDLAILNRRLADRIADGRLSLVTPGLASHLWRTTLDKLAVDQPGYASYLQVLAATTAAPVTAPTTATALAAAPTTAPAPTAAPAATAAPGTR